MPMPRQRPCRSKQDYQTPRVFLDAVRGRLGIQDFWVDLAASPENAVCPHYYTEEDDSLSDACDWIGDGETWAWLNPEFAHIRPWVKKAWVSSLCGGQVAVLVPAGVGANWWRDWVHQKARVLFLNGRLTFVGQTAPYPKDCVLLLYGPDVEPSYEVWQWGLTDSQP